jgi:psp operon transcriptional activator
MARELEFELFSGFTEKAKRAMLEYHWPGNVRELKNVVERSVYRCNNPHLPVHDLVIDPFESPYRPSQRIKTQDRISVVAPSVDKEKNEEKRQEVIHQQLPVSQSLVFPLSLKDLSQDYEIDLIQSALENCQYNQKKTADALKLTYHQLRGYLKKYNLLESAVDEG